jgi:hypothetical protein
MNLSVANYYKLLPWPEKVMELSLPKQIRINKKYYPVYFDLAQNITFGQKVIISSGEVQSNHDWIKKVLSMIYEPLINNSKFDVDKAKELEPQIDKCRIIEAYPTAMHYLAEMIKINGNEEEKLKNEPDADSLQAGIEQLSRFGVFAAVDSLASGDPTKYETIYELPYTTVFTKLWLETERSKFEKRLRIMLTNKNKK